MRAFVDFVVGHQLLGELGAAAQHDDEQAGGVGIERAAVADFLDAELAADGVHDVVRGGAGGFVDQNGAVERRESVHGRLAARS